MASYSGKYGQVYMYTGDQRQLEYYVGPGMIMATELFTSEATTGNVARTIYQIVDGSKRYWASRYPVAVYVNGAKVSSAEYVIAYASGSVYFTTPRAAGAVVTVTGYYLPDIYVVAECREWTLDIETDMLDAPELGSDWESFVDGQTGATGFLS